MTRPLRWLLAWAVDRWMRACPHDGRDVLADLLEGDGRFEVRYCRRCGAVRRAFETEWRRPRPLWAAEMKRVLLPLVVVLALTLAAPAAAETHEPYSVYHLGSRWYLSVLDAPILVPAGAAVKVTVGLDDIPGGLDSTPAWTVYPMGADKQSAAFTVSLVAFHPIAYSAYEPDLTLLIHNLSAAPMAFRVKVQVRGRE